MQQPKYRIYPSLLDKFEAYLRADEEAESFFNIDNETGEYKKLPSMHLLIWLFIMNLMYRQSRLHILL